MLGLATYKNKFAAADISHFMVWGKKTRENNVNATTRDLRPQAMPLRQTISEGWSKEQSTDLTLERDRTVVFKSSIEAAFHALPWTGTAKFIYEHESYVLRLGRQCIEWYYGGGVISHAIEEGNWRWGNQYFMCILCWRWLWPSPALMAYRQLEHNGDLSRHQIVSGGPPFVPYERRALSQRNLFPVWVWASSRKMDKPFLFWLNCYRGMKNLHRSGPAVVWKHVPVPFVQGRRLLISSVSTCHVCECEWGILQRNIFHDISLMHFFFWQ